MKELLNKPWELSIVLVIAGLVFYAQLTYLVSLYKRKVKPSYLSWLGWGILMGISLMAQLVSDGWTFKLISLSISTLGCFVIGLSARFVFGHYTSKPEDLKFIYAGLACILLYALMRDEWITTIIAITADAILAIPTIKNAFHRPNEEKTTAWIFAFSSWVLTFILVLNQFNWLHMLWPIYLIAFNISMVYLTYIRPKAKRLNT